MPNVINLTKGKMISLTKKETGEKLKRVTVGLQWGQIEVKDESLTFTGRLKRFFGGVTSEKDYMINSVRLEDVDLDGILFLYDKVGELIETVYYNRTKSSDGSCRTLGDDRTGVDHKGIKQDNETLFLDMDKIRGTVHSVVVVLNSYSRQDFGKIPYVQLKVYDDDTKKEFANYRLDNDPDFSGKTTFVLGVFKRSADSWIFKAVGEGTTETRLQEISFGSAKRAANA